jgi:hypothetical protein
MRMMFKTILQRMRDNIEDWIPRNVKICVNIFNDLLVFRKHNLHKIIPKGWYW